MIIICGCGGTGSNLAPMLSRMLNNETFLLIDGDVVEEKNIERQTFQRFDINANKARALARKLNSNFSNKHIYLDKYLESSDELINFVVNQYVAETDNFASRMIICGCVDNNATRKILEDSYLKAKKTFANSLVSQIHYIDSGNEDNFGTVLVNVLRSSFVDMEEDDHPMYHCNQEIAAGNLQQYQINLDMALAVAKVVFAIVQGHEYPEAIKINGFERSAE